MTLPRPWELRSADPDAICTLVAELGCSPLLATLLVVRGHADPSAARAFLQPSLQALPDPHQMRDAELAGERLAKAVLRREAVCVYGDYDVDGITAAALVASFLAQVGAPPRVFLPDRFLDGYGLQEHRVEALCDEGAQLFISVDCGSTACAAVALARRRGADFIIVDHHQLGAEEPEATAHLNPRRPGCGFAEANLAAVGVALVLVQATRRALVRLGAISAADGPAIGDLLELAALGTIADIMPLRGVNRTLAWHGLRRLGRSRRPGVLAMAERAGLIQSAPSADAVGFSLGPRINAAGRVSDATLAYELLTTVDVARAAVLADQVETENAKRKALQRDVERAALAQAAVQATRDHALVVADAGWHVGVVGIVAGRLRETFDVPAFVLSIEDGVARGSGRAPSGYDLVEGLRALDPRLFERFGGHAHAAGLSLPAAHLDAFREALAHHVEAAWPPQVRLQAHLLDAALEPRQVDEALLADLDRLEPCGRDNPRPTFLFAGLEVAEARRLGEDGAWVRARLVERSDRPLWARRGVDAFASAAILGDLQRGDAVDVAARLERNHWNGRTSLQAGVVALRPAAG